MSKLLSEEIVEAVTLGDKEGFMSAFHSALAAKVSDALEIKKVEIASTLIAPASNEVVEEEVELDEAKQSYEPKIHRNGEHQDPDTHPANGKPDAVVDIEDGRKALVFHNYDYEKGAGRGKHTYVRKTDGDDDYVYHNHPKVPAEKVKQDFTNLDEEVEQIDELDAGKGSILDRATKAARSKFKLSDINVRGTGMSKKTRDAHDRYTKFNFKSNQANHAQAAADASGTKYSDEYVSNIRQGKDWQVRMAKVKADRKAASDAKKAAKMAKEEVEQVDEATPEAKGQSRAEWRMGTADVIAKNNAKIADKKARAKKKLLAGKGK